MNFSLSPSLLHEYVINLVVTHLPDKKLLEPKDTVLFYKALQRVENCFLNINQKYYKEGDHTVFDHLNGDHMASLIYYYANTIWSETGETDLPTRLFYINKIMHGLDLFYSVKMPDIFKLVHPVGTVLGNAHYSDYFVAYQNCTVGTDETIYPTFGTGTILYSGSSVIGNCKLGDDVILAARAMIVNLDISDSTVVTGTFPNNRMHKNNKSVISRLFE